MADLSAQLEGLLGELRTALSEQNDQEIDRCEGPVRELLLTNDNYRFIGDERLLAHADILLTRALGEAAEVDLANLRQHLSILRDTHNKLYAVLNADHDLDSLLIHELTTWATAPQPITYSFNDTTKGELHKARTTGDSEQRLKNFWVFGNFRGCAHI
jgi:hypothetical protein